MVKEVSSDYKKVGKRWFFKEPLAKWFFYGIFVKNLLSTFIFKSVQTGETRGQLHKLSHHVKTVF